MAKAKRSAKKRTAKKVTKKMAKKASKKKAVRAAKPVKMKKVKGLPKKQLKKYKELLLKEREKAGGDLSHIAKESLNRSQRDASGDLSGYSFHMADVASDNYEMEFSLGRATDEQKLLYSIDEALRRVEEGAYGLCIQCGKKISKDRLRALPHTALCIECQKSNESK